MSFKTSVNNFFNLSLGDLNKLMVGKHLVGLEKDDVIVEQVYTSKKYLLLINIYFMHQEVFC